MTILLGLILLVTAATVTLVGMVMQAGGSQGFLFGVEVGVVGMVGLALVRGDVGRRRALRRLRRVSDRCRSETDEAVRDRDRLVRELRAERTHLPVPVPAPIPIPIPIPIAVPVAVPVEALDGDRAGR